MKSVYSTIAGKWFIDNVDNLSTDKIPNNVLSSLINFTEEGLYILADEMVWHHFWNMYSTSAGIDLEEEGGIILDDDELDEFLQKYREENFPEFKNFEEMGDYFTNKMEFLLELVVSWTQGAVKLGAHICFWDFIEKKAHMYHQRNKKVKSKKCFNQLACAKIVAEEKGYKDIIRGLLKEKKYEAASQLVKEYKSFIERKGSGFKSIE